MKKANTVSLVLRIIAITVIILIACVIVGLKSYNYANLVLLESVDPTDDVNIFQA